MLKTKLSVAIYGRTNKRELVVSFSRELKTPNIKQSPNDSSFSAALLTKCCVVATEIKKKYVVGSVPKDCHRESQQ